MVGSAGSGKTTLAAALAERLGVPHVELDSIFHQPNWQALPDDDFCRRVVSATALDGWVTCGNYRTVVQPVIWPRADTVVWLDVGKATVMRRVILRTLRRVVTREVLWNGNRERVRGLFPWTREESMIWWAWTNFDRRRETYERAMEDPRWCDLEFVRLGSPKESRQWLAQQAPPSAPAP